MTFSHRSFVENNEENVKLLHKCRERELIMTDAQCRTEEKVVCYLCTTSPCYKLLHRFYQSDPSWSWCMPACFWFCLASYFASLYINSSWPLSPHLDHLIIYILWTTATTPSSTVAPQLNWRGAPPSFLAALPHPSSPHCFLSMRQSIVFGQATLLAFQTQIYQRLDQVGTTFFQS